MESTRLQTTPINTTRKQRTCQPLKRYLQSIVSRTLPPPVVLLVFYALPFVPVNIIVFNIIEGLYTPLEQPLNHDCFHPQPVPSKNVSFLVGLFAPILINLLIPIAGWLSDTRIGHKRSLLLALWMGWAGTLLQTLSECFQYHSCSIIDTIGRYGLSSIALVLLIPSFTMFYATSLAYGLDLLIDSPSMMHCSFIYWFSWMFFLSGNTFSVIEYLSGKQHVDGRLALGFSSCFFFSLALCFYFTISWLLEENVTVLNVNNPYIKMFRILKYALTDHKHNENSYQSSLTYWENTPLSKIDIAKTKYGGPYSQEDVENVKTFFRIFLILLVLMPFMVSWTPVEDRVMLLVSQYEGGTEDLQGFASFAVFYIGDCILLLAIPILEFILIPIFPKMEYFLTNSLKSLGVPQILLIVAVVLIFVIDIAANLISSNVSCISSWSPGDKNFKLTFWILLIPSVILGISDDIFFVCVFQFICSQTPFEMNGMMIGLFWVIRSVCLCIGLLINHLFNDLNTSYNIFSCSSWLLIAMGALSSVGLVLYALTARWYTKRVRSDNLTLRIAVEDHFEQQISRRPVQNLLEESEV